MNKLTIRDIDVKGKRVLVRVDFNVPLDEKKGIVTDDSRIRESLPTIKHLIEQGAKVILMSHLGRPDGKVVESLKMGPVARRLSEVLGKEVKVTKDCAGPDVEKAVSGLKDGDVLLLENLRFQAEEEAGTPSFAQALAQLGDVYVDDAFGTAHRPHASITGVAAYLPAVAGLLMEKEITTLGGILEKPEHPFASLVGGAKISDKVRVLENLLGKVDALLVGGGMAATFLKAKGYEVGQSLIEKDMIDTAKRLMDKAAKGGVRLLLPADAVVAEEVSDKAKTTVVAADRIPSNQRIVDIGPQTVKDFTAELKRCKTVFWNGPMGIYEIPEFASGTQAIAEVIAGLKATTVIGGGSTAEAVTELKLADKMTFVSTGGGASLSFVGGDTLPGIEALLEKKNTAEA